MKKMKIMLLSFALLAIVGSALAFKARFSGQFFCTAATNGQSSGDICTNPNNGGNPFICNVASVNKTTIDPLTGGGSNLRCTTDPVGGPNPCLNLECDASTTLFND